MFGVQPAKACYLTATGSPPFNFKCDSKYK